MSYIHWLRKHLGHLKIPLVYATACIRNESGQILFQHRSDFNCWGLPGGVLELNETLCDCACREAKEETGLTVAPVRLTGLYSSPDFDISYPNGDQVQQVTACIECRPIAGRLHADMDETLNLQWYEPGQLPDTLPWYRCMLDDLLRDEQPSFDRGSPGQRATDTPVHQIIRPHIGNKPYIVPAAMTLCFDPQRRILLQQRADTGKWSPPGGTMETGERLDMTAVNETFEETRLNVHPYAMVGLYSNALHWVDYPNGDQARVVLLALAATVIDGTPEPDGVESLAVEYFRQDQLPDMASYDRQVVEDAFCPERWPVLD